MCVSVGFLGQSFLGQSFFFSETPNFFHPKFVQHKHYHIIFYSYMCSYMLGYGRQNENYGGHTSFGIHLFFNSFFYLFSNLPLYSLF